MSSYLCLQNYLYSRYPRGVGSIVIPPAYLHAEGCIVFTYLFVSKAYIRAYNNGSTAVLILCSLEFCLLSKALIYAFILTPYVSSYISLQNCPRSSCPRGVCNIVIPAAYLYAEGCIVFTSGRLKGSYHGLE